VCIRGFSTKVSPPLLLQVDVLRSLVQNSSFLVLSPAQAHNEEPLPNFLLALFGLGAASSPLSLSKIEVAAAK
jgi:hypothetical protein